MPQNGPPPSVGALVISAKVALSRSVILSLSKDQFGRFREKRRN
jgi:hypothetical protein